MIDDVQTDVLDAMTDVGATLTLDLQRFRPDGAMHFDPITIGALFGGMLLTSYCKGFQAQASEAAEAAGRKSEQWLHDRITRAARGEVTHHEATADLDTAAADAAGTRRHLSVAERERCSSAATAALEDQLVLDWNFPKRRATQVAGRVCRAGDMLLAAR
jgi:hypothetical protein